MTCSDAVVGRRRHSYWPPGRIAACRGVIDLDASDDDDMQRLRSFHGLFEGMQKLANVFDTVPAAARSREILARPKGSATSESSMCKPREGCIRMPASHITEQNQMEVDSDMRSATLPPTLPYGPEGTLLEDTPSGIPEGCDVIFKCMRCGRCHCSYHDLTRHMRIRHNRHHIREDMFERIIPMPMPS